MDLDGKSMSGDCYKAQVRHLYKTGRWNIITNFLYSYRKADKANPVPAFGGRKNDWTTLGGSVSVFYADPFDWTGWNANLSVGVFDQDQDIDFYDADAKLLFGGNDVPLLTTRRPN